MSRWHAIGFLLLMSFAVLHGHARAQETSSSFVVSDIIVEGNERPGFYVPCMKPACLTMLSSNVVVATY